MNVGKQDKHIVGKNNYDFTRGTLTADPQELYNLYAGKSQIIFSNSGKWSERERFTHTSIIGIYRDLQGNEMPTNTGIIHYSKKNGWHIIPAKPKKGGKHD